MRSTCCGARSGRSAMRITPLLSPATVTSSCGAASGAADCARAMPPRAASPKARPPARKLRLNIGHHLDRDHPVRACRRLAARDRIDMLHPADHPAIDGILAVKEMVVREVDEELTVRRIGVLRTRRAQRAPVMRHT